MISKNIPTPQRALAIGAHPDDIEFGAGATLAKWSADGCEVSLLICTDGSKGSWDPAIDPLDLVALRKSEQRSAADALGISGEIVFLDFVDGELKAGLEEREIVASYIRKLSPDVILGHDPWKKYRLHPDHREAGYLTIEGVVAARDPFFLPLSNFAPHRPSKLFLFEAEDIDHIETCESYEKNKLDALESHTSQFVSTMGIAEDDQNLGLEEFRRRITEQLGSFGELGDTGFAEGFKQMSDL
ncbi:MAG: PIG-L family deacetylase [Acidimicrobiales bacterium]|nr:PIG-L family deacetylase [Acidimicrobiales bacterium]